MGEGCFFEHVYAYGDIELDNNISISGPGTVLHAVKGKIKIGSVEELLKNTGKATLEDAFVSIVGSE